MYTDRLLRDISYAKQVGLPFVKEEMLIRTMNVLS